jgi:hypothetical protein
VIVWLSLATAAPVLALVEAGVEPRAPMALHPAVGTKDRVQIGLTLSAEMVNEGMELPIQALPPLSLGIATEVLESGPERIRYALTVVDAKAMGEGDIPAAMNEAMAPMTSIRGVATVDPFGKPLKATWEVPPDVDPGLKDELERAVELMFPQLPQEPVGVGARWTLTDTNDDLGFLVTDAKTWTLSERTDTGWVLDAQIVQSAEAQVRGPEALEKHVGAGQARVEGDATHLLPKLVKIGMTTRTRMILEGGIHSVTNTGLEATIQRAE